MVRGEIYFADLSPRSGAEQQGRRPCIIVSSDGFNEFAGWRTVTVLPLTSTEKWVRTSPISFTFQKGECGLPKNCVALAHQITTIDRQKVIPKKIGALTPEKLTELDQAIRNYLAL
jgi:mRNA interferase MazF